MVVTIYHIFTGVMLFASLLCFKHAVGRKDRLTFYFTSLVYGLVLEKLTIVVCHQYTYPASKYFLTVMGVPIAIGLGWSAVIYTSFETGKTLGFSKKLLPLFTGAFVLHVDLSMDAIAIRVPFWSWTPPGPWFGVALGNFFGWFSVALLFSGFFLFFKGKIRNNLITGVLTLLFSNLTLIIFLKIWLLVTGTTASEVILLITVFITSGSVLVWKGKIQPKKTEWELLGSLSTFHIFFISVLFYFGFFREYPLLIPLSLLTLSISFFVHFLGRIFDFSVLHSGLRR
ncbi:hypothetical protein AKJ38_02515 [candidate division MSBL1 archaeon SCGC-AAA259I14]|uniref:Carotenoid biosynthesis protein n=1 Tax=candidate division MSBL1 archaeon SCGC-AAA259I14 TaxID=1698268 RepID=A0A133URH1_9EURY|nr:hypothetical protein AKJ38_02515 [candidate division MSBL1 archaeon SCGC-AAA259I14]